MEIKKSSPARNTIGFFIKSLNIGQMAFCFDKQLPCYDNEIIIIIEDQYAKEVNLGCATFGPKYIEYGMDFPIIVCDISLINKIPVHLRNKTFYYAYQIDSPTDLISVPEWAKIIYPSEDYYNLYPKDPKIIINDFNIEEFINASYGKTIA